MSKLHELIEELCPAGIEFKTIREIATDIYRGSGIKRDQITDDGVPCVRYGEIYTTYNIWFEECVSHTSLEYVSSPKYFEYGDILFAVTGESIEDIAKSTAYVGNDKCLAGGDIVVLKHKENPKYLNLISCNRICFIKIIISNNYIILFEFFKNYLVYHILLSASRIISIDTK